MAASVSATITMAAKIRETLGTGVPASSEAEATIAHSAYKTEAELNATSSVPSTKAVSFLQALTDGAATIDLTSLVGANGAAVTGSGLRVQYLYLEATSTNANAITVSDGASNGYELAGNGWTVALLAGQSVAFYGFEKAPEIGASAKTIDLAGTGTQSVKVQIIMG